jgi:hypothetical protein
MKAFVGAVLILFSLSLFSTARAEVIWYPTPPEAYRLGEVYPEAQRLLFAFDYGHALVYELLLQNRGKIGDPEAFERELMTKIMSILKNPPHVKVDEGDIAPTYVYTFPLVINLFDWSHMLHQYVLDVMATSEDRGPGMILRINQIYDQYKANRPVMITDVCKTMLFMDGHYFSKAFRRNFPSFNLLIWSYHWFQIKLYEALLEPTKAERDSAVAKTIQDFKDLISDLPESADFDMMPETAKEAPKFAQLFPTIPAAFDNNHMLHDIVSDLLTSEKVSNSALRSEGIRMGRMTQDPEAFKSQLCNQ